MKMTVLAALVLLLASASPLQAGEYDASEDYICDASVSEVWSYEGYRASDGEYLSMVFGRAPLSDVSKYGVDAHYLPDSGQPFFPYIIRLTDYLMASPATSGPKFDAVVGWTAPEACEARVTGFARLMGTIQEESAGKKVEVMLVKDGEELWKAELSGGQKAEFDVKAAMPKGGKLKMHIANAGDGSDNLTEFDLKVETAKR